MAKRMIHYKSAEWYRIRFFRSVIIAIIVILLTFMPLGLMLRQNNYSLVMIIICALVFVFLIGFFFISCKANHVAWKEVAAEEAAKRKKVHRPAPVKRK